MIGEIVQRAESQKTKTLRRRAYWTNSAISLFYRWLTRECQHTCADLLLWHLAHG